MIRRKYIIKIDIGLPQFVDTKPKVTFKAIIIARSIKEAQKRAAGVAYEIIEKENTKGEWVAKTNIEYMEEFISWI